MSTQKTAERVSHRDKSDNYVFQRSLLAYVKAAEIVSGKVLELGTGSAYGVEIIAPKAKIFTTLDKFESVIPKGDEYSHVEFIQMNFPPLEGIEDDSYDYVISFQVIEHIQDDHAYTKEIHRVLKPGGKFIVTTPNKPMSITRNPWHIREYTIQELKTLLGTYFKSVEAYGVFGNKKIMDYYTKNKESVQKITRWDFLNLQYRLPRQILQIPYDIMNRRNRKKLLKENTSLVSDIVMEDYYIDKAKEGCFDLFYVAEKA